MTSGARSVVFLACSPWRFLRQREHELASGLAASGYRVFFIEPMPSLAGILRDAFRPDPAGRVFSPPPPGLVRLRPPVCLTYFRSSLAPAIDRRQLLPWLRGVIRDHRLDGCLLIYSFAYWEFLGVVPRLFGARRVFFDYSDDEQVYARNARALGRMRGASLRLAAGADCLLYSSRGMEASDVARVARRKEYLANGVRDALCVLPSGSSAAAVRREAKPVVGYAGQRSGKILDLDLLRRISASGKWMLRYAGTVDARVRRSLPGARFEGFVPPERLGAFIDSCDVCIIPFARNAVADLVEPLKLYEYLARGKPVVATATPSLAPFAEAVYLAEGPERFLELIDRAVREDAPGLRGERAAFARRNRWDERVRRLASLLEEPEGGHE